MPLTPEDQRHFTTAEGYIELGMPLDADEELEQIAAEVRHVPQVLIVRLEICRALEKTSLVASSSHPTTPHL